MTFTHSKSGRRTNQDVFFDYYPRLLGWAAQITRNDHSEAEDLVHDLYLRVSRINKPIDEMERLEHYLFKVLRNLHYSRLRRAGRAQFNDLSIVDYDSVEHGLTAVDRRGLFLVRSHLQRICIYACQRKSTARSASILILRFFHGYYPIELMKILPASRSAVDRSLQVARSEARLFLERPEVLRSIQTGLKPALTFAFKGDDTQQLFLELQEAIFSATEGECFDLQALEQRYAEGSSIPTMTTRELSHLVSCRVCLDRLNTVLRIPLLADRSPEDGIDRNNSSGAGGEGGTGITDVIRKKPRKNRPPTRKLERLARALSEHRPRSLEIIIDGEVRAAHKVSAEINEFRLQLPHKEEPSFVEVFSEQGFCLAYLQVEEPASLDCLEQTEAISLSDNRSLTVSIGFAADGPVVQVLYIDPVFAESAAGLTDATENPTAHQSGGFISGAAAVKAAAEPEKWIRRQISALLGWIRLCFKVFLSCMNPLSATAIVCAVALIMLFLLPHQSSSVIKPAELLQQADMAENNVAQSPGVIVESVRIQTPRRTFERIIHRDAQGVRRPRQQTLSPQDERLKLRLAGAGVNWNAPLSAADYTAWLHRVGPTRDSVTRSGKGLLTLTTTALTTNAVLKETLTVRDTDFHAVDRTVELRGSGTIEIAELNYEVLPWSAANRDWFEPLVAGPAKTSSDVHPALLPHLPEHLSDLQLDGAELEARLALHRIHADTSERLEVVRTPTGILVKGIVQTEARKDAIDSQLIPILYVTPQILTFSEVERQLPVDSQVTSIAQDSIEAGPSPLESYLFAEGESKAQVSQTYQAFFSATVALNQNSIALADLLQRFPPGVQLSGVARSALEQLVRQNETGISSALEEQESLLAKLGIASNPALPNSPEAFSPAALRFAATRTVALSNELIASNSAPPRSAEVIGADLSSSITQTNIIVGHLSRQFDLRSVPVTTSPVGNTQQ